MKNLFDKGLLAATALLIGALTSSCVYDRDSDVVTPSGGDGKLVININSSPVGSKTRATVITDGSSSENSTAEETITTMAIGIFSSDGATKKDYQYLSGLTGTASDWSTVTEHKALTNAIAAGDKVYVVVNVNSTVSDLLAATTTAAAFRAVLNTIDQSLIFADTYTAAQTIAAAKLPMYGSGTIAAATDGTTGNFEVDVDVIHMVSKVTLNALTVSAPASCQFTPTAIFLINVPEELDFTFTTDGDESTYGFGGMTTNFFQGESADVAASTNVTAQTLTTRKYRDYLGTGALTLSAVDASNPLAGTYTFYTMPNNSNTDDTRLVIAGNWSDDGGSSSTACWYAIELKNVSTDGSGTLTNNIYPNRHYKVNVDIKRIGALNVADDATGAYNGLNTQNAVHATVSVQNWSDGSKSTTFGGNGGAASES